MVIGWAACSDDLTYDAVTTDDTTTSGGEVTLDVSVGSALYLSSYTRSNPMGDSATQTLFNSGDQIAIATTHEEGAPEVEDSFLTYTYNGTTWNSTNGDYLEWGNSFPQYFYAYYPVNDTTNYSSFSLPTDQSTEEKIATADYMRGEVRVSSRPSNGKLTLEMERQTAKIKVRILSFSSQFSGTPTISSLTIYSRYSGISESTEEEEDITAITVYKEYDTSSEGDSSFYALVIPNAEADTLMVDTINNKVSIPHPLISLTVKDDGDSETNLTVTPNNVYPQLDAGYCYQYALYVGKDSIAVDSITVTAFESDTLDASQTKRVAYYDLDSTVTISQAWLSENITMKETTLYLYGSMETAELDTLRTWLAGDGSDAELILDLTNLESGIPDASSTAAANVSYYTVQSSSSSYNNIQYSGLSTVILPSAEDSEARKKTRSGSGISVGKDAFFGCSNLTSVVNSGNISSISQGSFSQCRSLTSLDISGIDTIPAYALACCYQLADLTLGSVKEIGNYAFTYCTALMTFDSNTVTSIGDYAFMECASLTTVSVPNATSIGQYCFYYCINLKTADVSSLTMTSTITQGYSLVSTTSQYLFANCFSLETVKWSTNTNFIPSYCFYYCYSLKNLSNMESVRYVGTSSFQRCTALETLPECFTDSLLSVDLESFKECYSLKAVRLNNAEYIAYRAFQNCTGIETVEIDGTTYVYDKAFQNCYALKSVKSENAYRIQNSAFENCTSLVDIDLPNIYELYKDCFRGCTALEYVNLPGLNYALAYCFRDCTSLKEAHLESLIDYSEYGVFWGCTALEEVEMGPGGYSTYTTDALGGYYFRDCKNLKKLDFSNYYKGDHIDWWGENHGNGSLSVAPCCSYTTGDTPISASNSDSIEFIFDIHTWRSIKYDDKVYYPADFPNDTAVYQPAFYGCNVEDIMIYVHDDEVKERLSQMFTKRALTYDDFITLKSYENVTYNYILNLMTSAAGLGWEGSKDDMTGGYWATYFPDLNIQISTSYTEAERLAIEALYYYNYEGSINAHYFGWGWNGFTEEYVDHIRVKDK